MSRPPTDVVCGVLVVDKPEGPTSHTVVSRVKRSLGARKAGHTGTLDPLATGVLPVCLGRATKLAGWLTGADKTYRATALFGVETDTQDITGTRNRARGAGELSRESLEAALVGLTGTILQTPPMYSSVKVDGRRLHELARQGREVTREPRAVTIHELVVEGFQEPAPEPNTGVPLARGILLARCSKGTYIRTLVADLGEALGTGACVEALRRVAAGPFGESQAVPLEAVCDDPEAARARVIPLDEIPLPVVSVALDAEASRKVRHGIAPRLIEAPPPGVIALRGPARELLAMAEVDPTGRVRILRGIG